MNWAKKLLTAGDCPRCGGRLEDLGDGQVSCDTCSYPEPEEDERIVCDVCGRIIDNDGEYPTCPVCGVALCGSAACAGRHIAEHHPEWDDDDDADDGPACDYCGRDIDPDANWMLDTRDGTEHFCCAECRDERAAEIEAAPLCAWCREKCDQGVVNSMTNTLPFCSTECLERYRENGKKLLKALDTGRCDDCERDGDCKHCPGHPGYTKPNPF